MDKNFKCPSLEVDGYLTDEDRIHLPVDDIRRLSDAALLSRQQSICHKAQRYREVDGVSRLVFYADEVLKVNTISEEFLRREKILWPDEFNTSFFHERSW
jgi:hypothetical protein